MNDIHEVQAYADGVNLIGDDIRTIIVEINADVLLNACKDIGLVVNTGTTTFKCMEIESHLGMIANEHIKLGNNSYEKWKLLNTQALY